MGIGLCGHQTMIQFKNRDGIKFHPYNFGRSYGTRRLPNQISLGTAEIVATDFNPLSLR